MPFIFVSYSRRDRPFINQFVPRLRRVYGHDEIWYDKDLEGGDLWAQEIQRNISECEIFVILLSPEAMQSQHCRHEWEQALTENKAILPVLIQDNTVIVDELEPFQYVDMSAGIADESMDKFHAAVHRLKPTKIIPVIPPPKPPAPVKYKNHPGKSLPRIVSMGVPILGIIVIGAVLLAILAAQGGIAPSVNTPLPTQNTLIAENTIIPTTAAPPATRIEATATHTPGAIAVQPTTTLPQIPTRSAGGGTGTASLNVIRSRGGVAFCNVNPTAFPLANFSVRFEIGAGEVYALDDEFPAVEAIAPGTCLCLRNRETAQPQQCSDTNSSAIKYGASEWYSTTMTLSFEGQSCVLSNGETEKRCF